MKKPKWSMAPNSCTIKTRSAIWLSGFPLRDVNCCLLHQNQVLHSFDTSSARVYELKYIGSFGSYFS